MTDYMYNRTWEEIEDMLNKAERKQNMHSIAMQKTNNKEEKISHMRNYKALEGAIKSLRWVLGDRLIEHPLE